MSRQRPQPRSQVVNGREGTSWTANQVLTMSSLLSTVSATDLCQGHTLPSPVLSAEEGEGGRKIGGLDENIAWPWLQ